MSENLGFALVILVAIASVASILFFSGTTLTGQISYTTMSFCENTRCPQHAQAKPLVDNKGLVILTEQGKPVCICPQPIIISPQPIIIKERLR